jgi:DNA-binding NarL/FixJ family response regulator
VSTKVDLVRAVRTVVDGGSVVDRSSWSGSSRPIAIASGSRLGSLTPTELGILALIAEG